MVSDETKYCHSLVPKIDDMVVEQLRQLGLSHLIVEPSVELTDYKEAVECPNGLQHLTM